MLGGKSDPMSIMMNQDRSVGKQVSPPKALLEKLTRGENRKAKPSAPPLAGEVLVLPDKLAFLLVFPEAIALLNRFWDNEYSQAWDIWMDSAIRKNMAAKRLELVWMSDLSGRKKIDDLLRFLSNLVEKHTEQVCELRGPGFAKLS